MKLHVLLSTYNGEAWLRQQLDSLISQSVRPDHIYVRDDGSKDGTPDILEEYAKKYSFITYETGENRGPAGSFWELIESCGDADYYALCDQDDVWFPDKLESALILLEKEKQDQPLLYCGKYVLTDKDLHPLDSNVSKLYGFTDFAHSLLYHTAPGCTFVFNHAAREKAVQYDIRTQYCLIHDAIIHKVTAMFGKVILDDTPHMYYRQHGNNEIGMDANVFRVFFGRVRRFLSGRIRNYRSETAKSLLEVYGEAIGEEEKELLRIVAYYREDPALKRKLLHMDCFRSHSVNDVFFLILVLVNYI